MNETKEEKHLTFQTSLAVLSYLVRFTRIFEDIIEISTSATPRFTLQSMLNNLETILWETISSQRMGETPEIVSTMQKGKSI